ncbi:hypothetical protein SF123566_2278 [Shigella flexneri 1235-66]|nr:hypothetical protein SF123566_2278 [Shigella flexneri 1235-66]
MQQPGLVLTICAFIAWLCSLCHRSNNHLNNQAPTLCRGLMVGKLA